MDLQFQIRQNALEVQSYVSELFEWEKKVAKRDTELKKGIDRSGKAAPAPASAPPPSTASTAPPVRGRAGAVVGTAPKSLQSINPALSALPPSAAPKRRIRRKREKKLTAAQLDEAKKLSGTAASHTYDAYRARWDKFDLDAALAEAEASSEWETVTEDEDEESSRDKSSQPSTLPPDAFLSEISSTRTPAAQTEQIDQQAQPPQPPQVSTSGFTFGGARPGVRRPPVLRPEPRSAEEWKDRGNEEYKGYQYEAAVDCYSKSLELQQTAVAYANRAMARLKLADKIPSRAQEFLLAAEEDCSAALAIDGHYVKALQRRATALLRLAKPRPALAALELALRLEPANAPLREERDAAFAATLQAERLKDIARPESFTVPVQRIIPAPATHAPAPKSPADILASAPAPAAPQVPPPAATGREGRPAIEVRDVRGGAPEEPADPPAAAARPAPAAPAPLRPPPPPAPAAPPRVPKTSTEFETAWKSFKGDVAAQARYLRAIPPASLPLVFKSSMTAPLLASVVAAALGPAFRETRADMQLAVEILENLARVPRFAMTVMGVPVRERAALQAAVEGMLAAAGEVGAGEVVVRLGGELRKQYRL